MKRATYFRACLQVAKRDPRWIRLVVADWNLKTEAEKDAHSMRRIHVSLLKLAMRRVHGESL